VFDTAGILQGDIEVPERFYRPITELVSLPLYE